MLPNQSLAKEAVFAIVISEKGGAERRVTFDQPELNIGRVQGNELMLPKGNVSKRHARLTWRDGRFIVSDLNSTNGTYVNRRRINQATIVRQGDRIYIGDFVLRIESQEEQPGSAQSPTSAQPIPLREPMMTSPDSGGARSKVPPAPPAPAGYPPVPPAPRVPPPPTQAVMTPAAPRQEPSVVERLPSVREDSIDVDTTAYRSAVATLVERVAGRVDPRMLDREVNEALASKVERTLDEQIAELRRDEILGAAIVDERLKRDARAELLELGALLPLIADETVAEIVVTGCGPISASRGGKRVVVEPPFSSEVSVRRVLGRLLRQAGVAVTPDASTIQHKLPNGFRLSAVTGARAPSGTLIQLERPPRIDSTLDDLVRAGTVSRAVATFLRHCVAVRANILVVGPKDARPVVVAGALASASPDGHVIAISDSDVIVSNAVTVSQIDVSGAGAEVERLVDFAARLPEARLVVDNFSGRVATSVLDAVSTGKDGLIAVSTATSLRRALARLPADLMRMRPALSADGAREWLSGAFDVLIEVARLRDGRRRAVRIAEPVGTETGAIRVHDIFSFVVERMVTGGAVEGTFQATGVAPRVVGDMTARGIHIDSGVFSRPPSR